MSRTETGTEAPDPPSHGGRCLRYRPGCESPRSVPVMNLRHADPDESGPCDGAHEDLTREHLRGDTPDRDPQLALPPPGEPDGLRTSRAAPDSTLRRTGRSNRGDVVVVVSCTDSAVAPVVWPRSPPPPEGFDRPGPTLGWRCARRYGGHLGGAITAGQGVFSNSQGCPRNFVVYPQNCSVRPPFMHSDMHSADRPDPIRVDR